MQSTLRELNAKLDILLGPITARLEDLKTEFPRYIQVKSKANAVEGSKPFSGYVMSNAEFTTCKLLGHFRANIAENLNAYAYIKGDIKGFISKYEEDKTYITMNHAAITITSSKQILLFENKK